MLRELDHKLPADLDFDTGAPCSLLWSVTNVRRWAGTCDTHKSAERKTIIKTDL